MPMTTQLHKFVAVDDPRIEPGFAHIGLRAIADAMGSWKIYQYQPIESRTLKSWAGHPEVIGWLITIQVEAPHRRTCLKKRGSWYCVLFAGHHGDCSPFCGGDQQ